MGEALERGLRTIHAIKTTYSQINLQGSTED